MLKNCSGISIGFTLSEVLITLVLIGIISSITVPTIYANYRREEASAKIKKFYSMLSNASTRAKADGYDWEYWALETSSSVDESTNLTSKEFAYTYLLPYINYNKTANSSTNFFIYLDDGSIFNIKKGSCLDFRIDVNGERRPNIDGRDRFYFLYCPYSYKAFTSSGRVIPYLRAGTQSRETLLQNCKTSPYTCSALLSKDNWVFKEDYPFHI